jgi:hypothetical protein
MIVYSYDWQLATAAVQSYVFIVLYLCILLNDIKTAFSEQMAEPLQFFV